MSLSSGRFSQIISRRVQYNYLLHLPEGYKESQTKTWPLMLFLHGAGERGNNIKKIVTHGPLKEIKNGRELPFIIVAPQCHEDEYWNTYALEALLDFILHKHRVDSDRIYVTGLSMGGLGTWDCADLFGRRIAAIAPICPPMRRAFRPESTTNLPVWCFHGAMDPVVPMNEVTLSISRIRKAGAKVKFTVYPEAGHDSWTETYANDEFYTWLLSRKLSDRKLIKSKQPED
jgi:predicted peptidase